MDTGSQGQKLLAIGHSAGRGSEGRVHLGRTRKLSCIGKERFVTEGLGGRDMHRTVMC